MKDRSDLLTEHRLEESANFDALDALSALHVMHQQDVYAVEAVGKIIPELAKAVEIVHHRLSNGGRLFYVGAGTSGRLGILDASECPPTFRSDPNQVQGIIAGGYPAIFQAQEGAEDNMALAINDLNSKGLSAKDAVMGIAAGGTTPYVLSALKHAKAVGAATLFLTCVQKLPDEPPVDVVLRPLTGPEVVTGSTRLKAGTATKLILNMISTITMVKLGKVYGNLMVDLKATNVKLKDRAVRILKTVTQLDDARALDLLGKADGHVKLAILMHQKKIDAIEAQKRLDRSKGSLREALKH